VAAYASISDLGSKWGELTGDARNDVEAALNEATVIIKSALKDAGIDPDSRDPDLLKVVTCRMVRRAFPSESGGLPAGLDSTQVSPGSFQQPLRWSGGRSGELLLYRVEKKMLGITPRAFSIDLLPESYRETEPAP